MTNRCPLPTDENGSEDNELPPGRSRRFRYLQRERGEINHTSFDNSSIGVE